MKRKTTADPSTPQDAKNAFCSAQDGRLVWGANCYGTAEQLAEKFNSGRFCNKGTASAGPISADLRDPGFSPCHAGSGPIAIVGTFSASSVAVPIQNPGVQELVR